MDNIIISSNIEFNEQIIFDFFKNLNKDINIEKYTYVDDYLPNQTFNLGGVLVCNDKINHIKKLDKDFNYIISINNCIKTKKNELIDYIIILMIDNNNNKKYEISGEELIIDINILEKYPLFANILDDLYNNYIQTNSKYIFDGTEIKLCELINKYYDEIPANNWIKHIFNIDNDDRINNLLLKLDFSNDIN